MEERELVYLLSQMFKMDLQNRVKIVNKTIKLYFTEDKIIKINLKKIN